MSDLHQLRVEASSADLVEGVAPDFREEKLLWARDKSWQVFSEIKAELSEGMTEKEAFDLSRRIFSDHGVTKHWHKPYVRFGPGTVLTFREPLQESYRLQPNDPVYIDLGPAWLDDETECHYEGDVGDTFVFGENEGAELCAKVARDVFHEVQSEWKSQKLSGVQIYEQMKSKVETAGYVMTENVQGHRISDFPHYKYSKEQLGRMSFSPKKHLWVLEVHIRDPQAEIGAFFEDILG